MKELFIFRHGKAGWEMDNINDIDRVLKERGILNVYDTASQLKQIPDEIITSPAARALHTATIVARVLNFPLYKLTIDEDLYLAEKEALLKSIARIDNNIENLMIVGHNPGLTELANCFLSFPLVELATASCVRIVFNVKHWNELHSKHRIDETIYLPLKHY